MNLKPNTNENRIVLQILIASGLFMSLILLFSAIFGSPSTQDLNGARHNAQGTKTALALTAGVLMGPFPTATGPTPTASNTPTITPTSTLTPTNTPTPTPIRYFIDTKVPRTRDLNSTAPSVANTPIAPIGPTSAPIQPTSAPPIQPTSAPPIQPTSPPLQPTSPPPQPTSAPIQPPTDPPVCVNPQGNPIPCH